MVDMILSNPYLRIMDDDRDILDFDGFEAISLKMKALIHGMVKERMEYYRLGSKNAPVDLGMCTESLRSLPERLQAKSKNRLFWVMIVISWILMDLERF